MEAPSVRCEFCDQIFGDGKELSMHALMAHSDLEVLDKSQKEKEVEQFKPPNLERDLSFMCDLCGSLFADDKALSDHVLFDHQSVGKKTRDESEEKEESCSDSESSPDDQIVPAATESRDFPCDFCDQVFADGKALSMHILTEHDDLEELDDTNQSETKVDQVTASTPLPGPKYYPDFIKLPNGLTIQKVSMNKEAMEQASQPNDFLPEKKRFECSMCDNSYTRKYSLTDHYNAVHIYKSWKHQCHKCDRSFNRPGLLRKHLEKLHLNQQVQQKMLESKSSEDKCDEEQTETAAEIASDNDIDKDVTETTQMEIEDETSTEDKDPVSGDAPAKENSLGDQSIELSDETMSAIFETLQDEVPPEDHIVETIDNSVDNDKPVEKPSCQEQVAEEVGKTTERVVDEAEKITKAHVKKQLYQCPICPRSEKRTALLSAHLWKVHGERCRVIPNPNGITLRLIDSGKDLRPKSKPEPVVNKPKIAPIKDKPKKNEAKNVIVPRIKKKDKVYDCFSCFASFPTKKRLIKHENFKHSLIKYTCDLCDKSLPTRKLILAHMRMIHIEL